MDANDIIISKDARLKIEFLRSREPNNGRMLWQVNVFLDGKNINDSIFDYKSHYINYVTKNWQLSDWGKKFYYIPIEGRPILIRTSNSKIIKLNYQELSTVRFEGNRFFTFFLIEIFNDGISVTNLLTLKGRFIPVPFMRKFLRWIRF